MKIAVCGICGRMGTSVLRLLAGMGHELGAAFDRPGASHFGRDAGSLIGAETLGVTVSALDAGALKGIDAIIDFSAPKASLELAQMASAAGKPLVIGTTGFSESERKELEREAKKIPLLVSPNMSLGVNLLFRLTEIAARSLKGYDIEIFEAHHKHKKDAPSGTAKRLLEIIKKSAGLNDAQEITGRSGITGERSGNEIGIFAMRGGDIVGEHTVFFAGKGERIELTHRASSRETFAPGAVLAAEYLAGRAPGLYTMFDVLGL